MQQPRVIYLASSPWFIVIASIFYLSTAIALLLIDWHWLCSAMLSYPLIIDYRQVIYKYGLRSHKRAVALIQQDCDKWQYQLLSGKRYKATLIKKRSYCSALVIIMYLKHLTGGRYVVIPRDSLSEHNYRFLAFYINCSS